MIKKLALAAGLAAGLALAAAGEAAAKVNVDINIGLPGPVYADPTPAWDPGYPVYYANRYVTCAQGGRIVRASGFRNVAALDCRGDTYTYRALARGLRHKVYLRAGNGRIFRVVRF